jgi:16S rRNA processing protein RimM
MLSIKSHRDIEYEHMEKDLITAGKIVNTHGIRGELRIDPWSDTPEFLCQFKHLYIDGQEYEISSCRPHKSLIILSLAGINDINDAAKLIGREISVNASKANALPRAFYRDLSLSP